MLPSFLGFLPLGVQVTAYTYTSEAGTPSTVFGTFCPTTLSTQVSLKTPYYIKWKTESDPSYDIARTSFASGLHTGCSISENYATTVAPGVVPIWTGSSSPPNLQNSAPATATASSASSSQSPQSSPRPKLIISVVVPTVVLMFLFTIGLSFFCICEDIDEGKELLLEELGVTTHSYTSNGRQNWMISR